MLHQHSQQLVVVVRRRRRRRSSSCCCSWMNTFIGTLGWCHSDRETVAARTLSRVVASDYSRYKWPRARLLLTKQSTCEKTFRERKKKPSTRCQATICPSHLSRHEILSLVMKILPFKWTIYSLEWRERQTGAAKKNLCDTRIKLLIQLLACLLTVSNERM